MSTTHEIPVCKQHLHTHTHKQRTPLKNCMEQSNGNFYTGTSEIFYNTRVVRWGFDTCFNTRWLILNDTGCSCRFYGQLSIHTIGFGHARCDPQYAIMKWTFIHVYKHGSSFKNMTKDTVQNFYTKRVPMRQIFNKVQGTVIRDSTRWFWKMQTNHWSRPICLVSVEADSTLWFRN
jgi:hypothetical protein